MGIDAPCELEPYMLFRDTTFCYNNEAVNIRIEKDELGVDMFLLIFFGRIIGYFEPTN